MLSIGSFARSWLLLAPFFISSSAVWAQTLTTDKDDYQPGETAVLTGSGFAPNEVVNMLVLHIDGTPSTGVAHDPWTVDADDNGNFMTLWECLEDCRGATLSATADQATGAHAEVEYTDALGIGRVSSVVPLDGGCTSTDTPCTPCGITSGTGAIQSWYVQQGKTYAVTLSCVTNCASAGTASTLQVLVSGSDGANPSSQCLTATKVATGVYTFTITMPDESCGTYPILYCTSGCSTTSGFNARRCDGRNFQAQLKASHFLTGCVPVALPDFADECCSTPGLSGVPADTVVDCDSVPTPAIVTGFQSCSQCSTVSVTFTEQTDQGAVGTCEHSTYAILRIWTVTDGCGQESSVRQKIRVHDITPPTISAPGANATIECPAAPNFTAPTASDSCGSASIVLVNDVTTSGCGGTYTQTKSWKAVDLCGNESATVSQTIAVVDTTPPIIGAPGANATLECPATPSFTAPTASDTCGAASVVLVSDVTTFGCGGTYSQTKTWKAVDSCGNESPTVSQTIAVADTTPPVIGAPGANATLECPASPNFTAPTASDTCGSASVVLVSDVTTPGCGTTYSQTKTWKAVDLCGNESSTVSQTIAVVDTTPPIIGAPGANATIECPSSPDFTAPTASDACGSASIVIVSDVTTTGCGGTFSQTKTWKAVDLCGNESPTVSQTIAVVDTMPPVIGPAAPDLIVECTTTPHFTVPTATDECGFAFAQQVSDVTTLGCGPTYTETKTWRAVDACGNQSGTVSQTINVVDTTPPVLNSCAPPLVLSGDGNSCLPVHDLGRPTAVDACGMVFYQPNPREGECFPVGDTQVSWMVRDACGNFVTCGQTVSVLALLHLVQFYDANANGTRDLGEPGIPGWKFTLSDGQTGFTDASGVATFHVAAGTYTVNDATPLQSNWVATTPTSSPVTLSQANCNPTINFGSYSFAPPANGTAPIFWSTRQGAALLQAHDSEWRSALSAMNLRNGAGTSLDLMTRSTPREAVSTFLQWLNSANETNMAYMLSAKLAVAKLDAMYMGLSDSTAIVVPGGVRTGGGECIVSFLGSVQGIACGWPPLLSMSTIPGSAACGCSSNDGVVTISDLFARAECLLGAYGNVTTASTQRTYEECLKALLDMIVSNGNNGYACGGLTQYIRAPGSVTPPTFP